MDFQLVTSYKPRGDQPRAIEELMQGLSAGEKHQVLLGVTGSGKTFTMAKVIEQSHRPALVMAHNKTLAAQLYHEFKSSSPTTPSNTSSPTTTTTSRRPTFRPATFISRRNRRSMMSWTSCGCRRRAPSLNAAMRSSWLGKLHLRSGFARGLLWHVALS